MTAPVLAWQASTAARLGLGSTLPVITAGLLLALFVVPAVVTFAAASASLRLAAGAVHNPAQSTAGHRTAGAPATSDDQREPRLAIACRFAFALVPLGLSMWTAHFVFHLLSGAGALPPIIRRLAAELGSTLVATPAWAAPRAGTSPEWITGLELLLLDGGLLASLYSAWRIAVHRRGRSAGAVSLLAPWALVALGLWAAGVWIVFQPMEMRGMVH
jgi:hypothetical protein